MRYILLFFFLVLAHMLFGQSDSTTTKIEADTVLANILKGLSEEKQEEIINEYKNTPANGRESLLLFWEIYYSLPQSSKQQLIQNIDTNYSNVAAVKKFLNKTVPPNYIVSVEFNRPNKFLKITEGVSLSISKKENGMTYESKRISINDVELTSPKLDSLLKFSILKKKDLAELKNYMDKANCISISNGDIYRKICKIGYSRSGMGMYSYLIFDKPLTIEERKQYNNGCENIFYKDNIVLVYDIGAVGSPCFPDKK